MACMCRCFRERGPPLAAPPSTPSVVAVSPAEKRRRGIVGRSSIRGIFPSACMHPTRMTDASRRVTSWRFPPRPRPRSCFVVSLFRLFVFFATLPSPPSPPSSLPVAGDGPLAQCPPGASSPRSSVARGRWTHACGSRAPCVIFRRPSLVFHLQRLPPPPLQYSNCRGRVFFYFFLLLFFHRSCSCIVSCLIWGWWTLGLPVPPLSTMGQFIEGSKSPRRCTSNPLAPRRSACPAYRIGQERARTRASVMGGGGVYGAPERRSVSRAPGNISRCPRPPSPVPDRTKSRHPHTYASTGERGWWLPDATARALSPPVSSSPCSSSLSGRARQARPEPPCGASLARPRSLGRRPDAATRWRAPTRRGKRVETPSCWGRA